MNLLPNACEKSHRFNPGIFREYDIRGIVGKTLFAEDAYWIGRAFAFVVKQSGEQHQVCVGRDGRLTSPDMTDALCKGLVDGGVNVVSIGLGPTPMLYYASVVSKSGGGVMVTGSHNPPDHNGFKFMLQGKAFYGVAIQELREIAEAGISEGHKGTLATNSVTEQYIAELLRAYDGNRELKVAWDAGNGAAGEIMQALCQRLNGTHHALFAEIDGSFPNHHPDPTVPKNLIHLRDKVRDHGCDAGVAFDGDGDRIGVVDDEGEILWGDQLMMLYAVDILLKQPGATIIADVKASQALFDEVARMGGTPLMWKTGHSLIKSKMAETNAPLAGEMSGHIFFADRYYGFDDALYAAIRLLGLLSRSGKKLSDLRKALPQMVNTPEIRFPCDDARKFAVIEEVKSRLLASGSRFSDVDGVRVMENAGWWLLRASNTQAMLVARCEAKDEQGLRQLQQALSKQLMTSGLSLPDA